MNDKFYFSNPRSYERRGVFGLQKPLLDALPKLSPNGLTSVELFAGGGLMRLGIEWAGIETIWANDFDKNAVRAHTHNFGDGSCVLGDITQIPIESIPDADIIVGGPPCQDYSLAGKGAGAEGERGKLVWRYLEIIEKKRPMAFLFENVKGLTTKKHRPTFDALLQRFDEIGYNVSWKIINAWDYGVAQKRERVFIVGIRKDLEITFEFPMSEYETTGYRPVLRDAIGDLPEPEQQRNGGHLSDNYNTDYEMANRVESWDEAGATVTAHHRCSYTHPQYANHKNIKNERTNRNESSTYNGAKLEYAIQEWDDACNTVTEKARGGDYLCHPKPRRFTVRECLRIQSVPDTYVFPDGMSLSAMYRVVGNGVASRVAYHLGKALSEQLLAVISADELKEAA